MKDMELLNRKIMECDDIIMDTFISRLDNGKDMIKLQKENGLSVIHSDIDLNRKEYRMEKIAANPYREELSELLLVMDRVMRKVQIKQLFSRNIMLIGFMGTGKSTVSAYLSKELGMEEVDMDALIVKNEGISIASMFEQYGETYFRDKETQTLAEVQKRDQLIVSCGGGIVLRDENIELMKGNGRVVLLTATPETIYDRVKSSKERPILNSNMSVEYITELMEKRRERYMQSADVVISTDGKSIPQICEEIVSKVIEME
jgi:shikimate kinase